MLMWETQLGWVGKIRRALSDQAATHVLRTSTTTITASLSRVIAGIEWRLIGIFRVRDLPNITFEINTLMFLNKINEYVVGRFA